MKYKIHIILLLFILSVSWMTSCHRSYTPIVYQSLDTVLTSGRLEYYGQYYKKEGINYDVVSLDLYSKGLGLNDEGVMEGVGTNMYISDIWATDEYLYVYEAFGIKVIDIRTGRDVAFLQADADITKGFVKDGSLICVSLDGGIYRCDGYDLYEITDQLFSDLPDQKITDIRMFDNRFFCLFERAAYVARYVSEDEPEFDEYEDDISDYIYRMK